MTRLVKYLTDSYDPAKEEHTYFMSERGVIQRDIKRIRHKRPTILPTPPPPPPNANFETVIDKPANAFYINPVQLGGNVVITYPDGSRITATLTSNGAFPLQGVGNYLITYTIGDVQQIDDFDILPPNPNFVLGYERDPTANYLSVSPITPGGTFTTVGPPGPNGIPIPYVIGDPVVYNGLYTTTHTLPTGETATETIVLNEAELTDIIPDSPDFTYSYDPQLQKITLDPIHDYGSFLITRPDGSTFTVAPGVNEFPTTLMGTYSIKHILGTQTLTKPATIDAPPPPPDPLDRVVKTIKLLPSDNNIAASFNGSESVTYTSTVGSTNFGDRIPGAKCECYINNSNKNNLVFNLTPNPGINATATGVSWEVTVQGQTLTVPIVSGSATVVFSNKNFTLGYTFMSYRLTMSIGYFPYDITGPVPTEYSVTMYPLPPWVQGGGAQIVAGEVRLLNSSSNNTLFANQLLGSRRVCLDCVGQFWWGPAPENDQINRPGTIRFVGGRYGTAFSGTVDVTALINKNNPNYLYLALYRTTLATFRAMWILKDNI